MVADDPNQTAVFDLSSSPAWLDKSVGFQANAVLESNTVKGSDFSPFRAGGILDFSTTGVTVDRGTNTATVSEDATGSFVLKAVPEPTTALLAVIGGSLGLLSLWHTRKRHVGA
jgi:hypothetical protein